MSKQRQPIPECEHGVSPALLCEICHGILTEAIDVGGDKTLEADGNGNSDLRRARTARFHINREPKGSSPR